MKPVDCHCHLNFEQFEGNLEKVIQRAKQNLEFVICAGCDYETNERVLEIADQYDQFVLANLGIHPTFTDGFEEFEKIEEQIRVNDPLAIGEVGLDHHHVKEEEMRERQEEIFRKMISISEDMQKPLVVHSREAEQRCIEVLVDEDAEDVMMHCFNGTVQQAEEAIEQGFKIGVTTQALYSSRVEEIIREIDIEDMILETDSPFLYPEGVNEPSNVTETVAKIAEIKNISEERINNITTENAREFFGLN